jgi:hypothetical protein
MPKTARERAERLEKSLGSGKFWKAPVGKFTIRVLPTPANKKGEDDQFLEYNVHDKVGKDKRFLRCGKNSEGKGKCWLCDVIIPKLRKAGKDSRAAALEPLPKVAVQIAVVAEDGSMDGPHMWLPNKKVQRGLAAKVFNNTKKDPADEKKGRNLEYKRVGTGMKDTDYFGPDMDDEPTRVPKEIMKALRPFEEAKKGGNLLIAKYSEDDQKKAYLGEDADSSSESESASKSSSGSEDVNLSDEGSSEESEKKSKKKTSKKSKKEESSSESESESGSESESESESSSESEIPKKSKKKPKKNESASEESSSESESESSSEEESKKPKKKTSKKSKKEESASESSSEEESS